MQSARIHDLKVNLMVNALKCREVNAMTLRSYGQLLNARSGEFDAHEQAVKRSLEGRFGSYQAAAIFDDYETRLGNFHSGMQPSMEKCDDTAAHIRLVARANSAELETLSRLVTNRGIRVCPVEVAAVPRTVPAAAPVPAPAQAVRSAPAPQIAAAPRPALRPMPTPQPAVQTAPQAASQPVEIVDGIPTYSTPGTGPDSEPVPMERVVVPAAEPPVEPAPEPVRVAEAEPEAPVETDEREAKLAQAITALDAAAAALRGMQESAQTQNK